MAVIEEISEEEFEEATAQGAPPKFVVEEVSAEEWEAEGRHLT